MKDFRHRTRILIGSESTEKLNSSCVCVCGLGGVGSWAAEALCRAGIGNLLVADFDTVNNTNINRQAFALLSSVGTLKTLAAMNRLHDINPQCRINVMNQFIDKDNIADIIAAKPNVVIDAIDSLSPKVRLLHACVTNRIPVITSMGAGGKLDPSLIKIGDISESINCHLARYVRKKLHRLGIFKGIRCVYSIEKPISSDISVLENDADMEVVNGRIKAPLGSISFITGTFGMMAAAEAVKIILSSHSDIS